MLRRLIVTSVLAACVSLAAVAILAEPALAKGPIQASITGPGLARAIVVSGNGEPGQQQSKLEILAEQTGLFVVLFGANAGLPWQPTLLSSPPPQATLGPRYTVSYTVPGVNPGPGEQYGHVRQYLYPRAAGGPVIYVPPAQEGFGGGQPLVTGWLRARAQLTRTLTQLGVPSHLRTSATVKTRVSPTTHPVGAAVFAAWLIAAAAAIAATALALWRRQRKPVKLTS